MRPLRLHGKDVAIDFERLEHQRRALQAFRPLLGGQLLVLDVAVKESPRFMAAQQACCIGEETAINILVIAETVTRKVGRCGARLHANVDEPMQMTALEIGVVRRLENHGHARRIVDRRDSDRMPARAQHQLARYLVAREGSSIYDWSRAIDIPQYSSGAPSGDKC